MVRHAKLPRCDIDNPTGNKGDLYDEATGHPHGGRHVGAETMQGQHGQRPGKSGDTEKRPIGPFERREARPEAAEPLTPARRALQGLKRVENRLRQQSRARLSIVAAADGLSESALRQRLAAALRPGTRRVVCLGDSFHDGDGPARLAPDDAQVLRGLVDAHDWIWVTGNHDPILPEAIGGRVIVGDFALDGLMLRHQAGDDPHGEVSGHYHPKSHIDVLGRRLSGACFIHDERRIVLPAFGAYTGGLAIESAAIRALFPSRFCIDLMIRGRLMRRAFSVAIT